MGKPIIMGRKTYESIGRPLPGRENIVLTRDKDYSAEGCLVIHDLDQLSTLCDKHDELMIIGGAELYAQILSLANRIYLTKVMADVEGDIFFPEFDHGDWIEISREIHTADQKNEYDYHFLLLEKKAGLN